MHTKFSEQDWAKLLVRKATDAPRSVSLAFFIALAVNIVCWFYDLAQFPLGDHDVGHQNGISILSGGRSGRWFAPATYLLSGYTQIPVWTQLLSFCAQIAAGMLAVFLWLRQTDFLPLLCGGLLLSCMPTATDFYYFHWQAPTFVLCQLFMALSIFLSCPLYRRDRKITRVNLVLSVIFATCAIALYQSCIMTWTVLFWGCFLMHLLRDEQPRMKDFLDVFVPPAAAFAAAVLLYSISLRLYPLAGISTDTQYQFRLVSADAVLRRIFEVVKASYAHFFVIQPFLGPWLKGLLLSASIGGFAALLCHAQKRGLGTGRLVLILCGLLSLPIAAKAQFFISAGSDNFYLFRFTSLGLNYVYLFFLLALLTAPWQKARNAGLGLGLLLLPAMIINCLHQQILHVRSNTHDLAVLNRIVARLEEQPDFSLEKSWNFVQFGQTTPYMARTYSSFYNDVGQHSFNSTILPSYRDPGIAVRLIEADLKFAERVNEKGINEKGIPRPEILQKAVDFAEGKKAFPAPGSVGIVDDIIVLVLDEKFVKLAKNNLTKLSGPTPQPDSPSDGITP